MAFVKNVLLEFRTSTGPDVYTMVYCASDASIEIAIDTVKITDTVNGKFNKILPIGVSGTMQVKGLVRIDSTLGLPELAQLALDLTPVKVRYSITDTGGVIKRFLASGYITSVGVGWTVFSLAENNISITLSGIITIE